MKWSRNLTNLINRAMDQLLPPLIRDARWFMWIPMRLFAGDKAEIYMAFKARAFEMSEDEYANCYRQTADVVDRETDLNKPCLAALSELDCGETVLDAGCGRGFLANILRSRYRTTACDVVIDDTLEKACPDVDFLRCSLEKLPFPDDSFDTVICTHVLEHVLNPQATISELRRVARKQLIIVVPCERPYRHTFSLHIHFFPYAHSLLFMLGRQAGAKQVCRKLGGDWYYTETYW